MKKIFIYITFVSGLLLTSCDSDLLTPFTPGSLTEESAITQSSDLQKLMNSTYNILSNRSEVVFSSVFTDEVGIGYANGGQGLSTEYIFLLIPSSEIPANIWVDTYSALARANRVIQYADKIVTTTPTDAVLISRLKAEALTIRAYGHLKILSYYSPNLKDDNALAGILANKVFSFEEKENPRVTNGVFYAQIQKDLDDALSIYNGLSNYTADNKLANKNFAKGLKARAYAYKGDYINAEKWADEVINTSQITLANPTDYRKIFFTDNEPANKEVIFRLKRTPQQNTQLTNLHNGWCSVAPNVDGSPFYEVSRSLFNILNQRPTDVRRSVIVAPSSVIDPNYATSSDYRNTDKLIIQKHGGTEKGNTTSAVTSTNGFNNDYKIMRISEMYLIKAEARANAGDLAGVGSVLKSILDERFGAVQTAPVYSNIMAAWADILKERRLELAYEGHRYIDLKRLAVLANVTIDRDPADYLSSSSNFPAANPVNLPNSSYKFALPIPQDELNANPGIKQNIGY
ncbi:RagB/SusD family nutrient uptake outer membrane protein [Chryseobacterium sp. BIGb0232]|uniref:RagB/SusD family nutrient uptake outer membrane protein n=1 Tax=Chryseobacterium sp. BIGb0232 TaxID=2940598 RepID=UPI000FA515F2|nr:RagB/SusD family nutrient uptake outer membrane protein [Chryseobacterium sp. BIGb0232]MCS4301434.1 tetratricopeptide (TPR) repeat protein [Chryseobacterium sp. BIGb0232]ROS19709.1 putative outer membrane starch-binding protein [Chryseobacterium nakagawai]